MNTEKILSEMRAEMQKALDFTENEFNSLHTGKASPAMVEQVQVEVPSYGTSMHLRDLAAITTPDARTIAIEPWDKGVTKDIERALQKANLGMNPVVAGAVIRMVVPDLSRERREELVKVAGQHTEDGKVGVRKARRDAMDALKEMQKDGEISEDDLHRLEKSVQKATDEFVKKIEESLAKKEQELLSMG